MAAVEAGTVGLLFGEKKSRFGRLGSLRPPGAPGLEPGLEEEAEEVEGAEEEDDLDDAEDEDLDDAEDEDEEEEEARAAVAA